MAIQKSRQVNLVELDNAVQTSFINPEDSLGRLHVFRGDFNTTDDESGTLAQDDELRITIIPTGTTLYTGAASFEDMGASATLDLGLAGVDGSGFIDKDNLVADDPDFFTPTPIDVAAAGNADFLKDVVTVLFKTEKPLYITGTLSGAIWAADKDLKVHVFGVDRT